MSAAHDWYHHDKQGNKPIGFMGVSPNIGQYKNGIHVSPQNQEYINNYVNRSQQYQNVNARMEDNKPVGFMGVSPNIGQYKNGIHVSPQNQAYINRYMNRAQQYQH